VCLCLRVLFMCVCVIFRRPSWLFFEASVFVCVCVCVCPCYLGDDLLALASRAAEAVITS